MSATAAIIGKGTILSTSPDGTTWTPVAEVVDIKMFTVEIDKYEATRYDSTNIERLPGYQNPGEAEFTVNYLTAQVATLRGFAGTSGTHFKVTYPDTHTDSFTGFISSYGPEVPMKGIVQQKFKITLQTLPVYA